MKVKNEGVVEATIVPSERTAVLLIDMQPPDVGRLLPQRRDEIVAAQSHMIAQAIEKRVPFILVEFQDRGYTIDALAKPIRAIGHVPMIVKKMPSAFSRERLDRILRQLRVQTLLLMGVNASECVFATARDAREHGYNVITAGDLIADRRDCSIPDAYKAGYAAIGARFEHSVAFS